MIRFLARYATVVVATSAVLLAAALWLTLVTRLAMQYELAGLITGLVLLSIAQLHVYLDRAKSRKSLAAEVERIMVATHDLLADMSGLRADVDDMRKRIGEKNFLHADRVADQVGALEAVVERLVEEEERRGSLESRLVTQAEVLAKQAIALREARSATRKDPPGKAAGPEAKEAAPKPAAAAPAPADPPKELVERVTTAVAERRADIHLQPIVTLPQRKVRYYEALMRLRDGEGHTIMPREFVALAETGGLIAEIDNLLLFRSITLVRRLAERRRDVGIFCNISPRTLLDPDFFPQFMEFMELNQEIAPHLVLEVAQASVDEFGPLEEESLHALAALGFRLSMDHVARLDMDFGRLADLGFRFVKVEAGLILDTAHAQDARVHPEDMAKLAARHNVELIVEKIEAENTVVNILDFEVRLAQGYLFARPRPIRDDGAAPLQAAA